MAAIALIAGLGNPGARYASTRHNAGFRFLHALCQSTGCALQAEGRFKGSAGRCVVEGHELWLLAPATFMNASGESVAALARFYKIPAQAILVVHDDLDLPLGTVRLKQGGGTGGHNGLASVQECLGSQDFLRLRLGIGRPAAGQDVIGYVLGQGSASEWTSIDEAIQRALGELPGIVSGEWQAVMGRLHTGS